MANGNIYHWGVPQPILTDPNGFILNAEDNQWHDLRINWNPQTLAFKVYVDCNLKLTYTGDIVNHIFNGNAEVFWGFTSATGAARNAYEFCLEYVSFIEELQDTTICEGSSVQLNAGAGASNLFVWTPSTGLSNAYISSPIATPESTTTYTVYAIDNCGNTRIDSVTISVRDEIDDGTGVNICLEKPKPGNVADNLQNISE